MKNNKGFSLVELIVVIAIMAILAAVAVVGVSIYIPKARQAKDRELVNDIKYAMNLYSQEHAGNLIGGYVVITPTEIKADGDGEAALEMLYGSTGWQGNKLAYESWDGSETMAMLNLVDSYENGEENIVLGSTYLSDKITTDEMMGKVAEVLGIAVEAIDSPEKSSILNQAAIIIGRESDNYNKLSELANDPNVSVEAFKTAVANALVGDISSKIDSATTEEEIAAVNNDPFVNLMHIYANAYAYSEATGDMTYFETIQQAVIDAEEGVLIDGKSGLGALKELGSPDFYLPDIFLGDWDKYDAFESQFVDATESGISAGNKDALNIMMGAVSRVSGTHTAEDLLNEGLYTSHFVANQIDAYKNAIKMKAVLGDLPELNRNDIIILLLTDGTIYTSIDVEN